MQETIQHTTDTPQESLRLVAVKFRPAGRHYDFHAAAFELKAGDRVVVETDRGRALATVVQPPRPVPRTKAPDDLKNVIRLAAYEDLTMAAANAAREDDAYRFCLQRIQERNMPMKLVRAEYLFDGSKIIFYFTADGRVDFRELVKDLAYHLHTRIEMRQIGVRDEAKIIGGLGVCGRELCCCTFLTEFAPVSVKMAKEQGLALNPNKISGQCGRLLCCLAYEYETYCSLRKCLPKCGKKVKVGNKDAEVLDQNILGQTITVRTEDGKTVALSAEQLERECLEPVPDSPPPPEPPAQAQPAPERRPPRERQIPKTDAQSQKDPREGAAPAHNTEAAGAAASSPPASPETPRRDGKKRRNRRRPRRKQQ